MSEKCEEILSIKVTETIKKEYQELSEKDKKNAKRLMLDSLCQFLWSKNHYEPEFYFGDRINRE